VLSERDAASSHRKLYVIVLIFRRAVAEVAHSISGPSVLVRMPVVYFHRSQFLTNTPRISAALDTTWQQAPLYRFSFSIVADQLGFGPIVGRSPPFIGPRNTLLWTAWHVRATVQRRLRGLKHRLL